MEAPALSRLLQDFVAESHGAVVLEGGEILFDFATARYSINSDHGKCLLHLWSDERNTVRRVVEAEHKNGVLRLTVQRFGQSRPAMMEICPSRDRRTPTAKKSARSSYRHLLERVLARSFPDLTLDRISTAADLEHSFGPVYTRGVMKRGNSAWAMMGVNLQENQSSIDGIVTFGVLWLDACRQKSRHLVEGLRLFVPTGTCAVVRERMAHLNHHAAKFELYELDEREGAIERVDCTDRGNVATRLVHCPDEQKVHERFSAAIARVCRHAPDCELHVLSPTEIAFRVYGLEFARARIAASTGFRNVEEIVFGVRPYEAVLTEDTAADFAGFLHAVLAARRPDGQSANPLWRMHPERWLESLVTRNVAALDSRLDPGCVYSQVPAFSASDRAMIDVLTLARDGRLALLELKADEDIHLPFQGLDYWARVEWHRARGEFQRFGYFPGREIAPQPPLLLLVAPALHVHPATDILLRYIAPEIDCELLAVGEKWRQELRVTFRKKLTPGSRLPIPAQANLRWLHLLTDSH